MVAYFTSEKLKEVYPKVQNFLEDHIYPHEQEWLKMPFKQVEIILRSKKELVKKTGCWNLYLSETHGGPGFTLMEIGQMGELLGTSPFGHFAFNCQAPDAGNIELLLKYASSEITEKFVRPLIEGEIRSCFGMTEPEYAGSNPVRMGTTAVQEGDHYVLNGHKWFTTGADGASFCIVMCITNPEADNPYAKASMILVPTDTPGFELVRNIPIMGHPGEGNMSHSEVRLENVAVPAKNLLGGEGEGFKLAQERLGPGRIHHCMRWIGIATKCFDLMCSRAASRELKEGRTLGQMQMVQKMIAESKAEIDAARLLVLDAAYDMQHKGQKAARKKISGIKFFTSDVMLKVIDRAIQVHGALGITDDTVLSWYYREERGARIYDGTDETHKASLARQILKNY